MIRKNDISPGYILNSEFNRDDVVNKLSFESGTLGMSMPAYKYTRYASEDVINILSISLETFGIEYDTP